MWKGAQRLAEDVRYCGKWMRDEAEKRIDHLYPKVEIAARAVASAILGAYWGPSDIPEKWRPFTF